MFKKILISDIVVSISASSFSIFTYWYIYVVSGEQKNIALLGVGQLLGVFFSIFGGALIDKYNKVNYMRYIVILKILLLLLLLSMGNKIGYINILPIYMFFSALLGSLYSPILETIIPCISENDEQLYKMNTINASFGQFGGILAVFISALYVYVYNIDIIISMTLIFNIFGLVLLYGIKIVDRIEGVNNSVIQNIKNGFAYVFKTGYIIKLLPVALIMNLTYWTIFFLLPKISIEEFHFFKLSYNLFELFFGIGGILGGLIFYRFIIKIKNMFFVFIVGLIGQSIMLIFIGIGLSKISTTILILIFVLWAFYAIFNTIVSIVYFSNVQKNIPKDILGSVIGTIFMLFSLINPMAAALTPFVISYLMVWQVVVLSGGIMLVSIFIILIIKDIRKAFN